MFICRLSLLSSLLSLFLLDCFARNPGWPAFATSKRNKTMLQFTFVNYGNNFILTESLMFLTIIRNVRLYPEVITLITVLIMFRKALSHVKHLTQYYNKMSKFCYANIGQGVFCRVTLTFRIIVLFLTGCRSFLSAHCTLIFSFLAVYIISLGFFSR